MRQFEEPNSPIDMVINHDNKAAVDIVERSLTYEDGRLLSWYTVDIRLPDNIWT